MLNLLGWLRARHRRFDVPLLPAWQCLADSVGRPVLVAELGGYVLILDGTGHSLPAAVIAMGATAVATRIAGGRPAVVTA